MRPTRRALAHGALAAGAVLTLCGFQAFGQPPGEDEPDHPDDPRWAQFRGVRISLDKARGVMRATFPADLQRINGCEVDIGGYMTPLQTAADIDHFILTRRSSGCPFCPPNEAFEALEVFTRKKVRFERRQWFVKGRLKLAGDSDQGLFFQLVDASAS